MDYKIYRTGDFHHKNSQGMDLVKRVFPWNGETDGIIICNTIDENVIYNPAFTRVIIGPGVDFMKSIEYFRQYNGDKTVFFNCLSSWNHILICREGENPKVKYCCIPFPVNVDKFIPALHKKQRYFVYFKHRHTNDLNILLLIINEKGLSNYEHRIFIYGEYEEDDYLNYIQEAEFGIWVGSHESQGFAFEEAMSCNCPLFVYDVKSLKDECFNNTRFPWGHLQGDYPATTASYFNRTCGVIVKEAEDISQGFDLFYSNRNLYKPREYVLNHLTAQHFYDNVQNLFSSG